MRKSGVRIVALIAIALLFSITALSCANNGVAHGENVYYGLYPQSRVGEELENTLESMYLSDELPLDNGYYKYDGAYYVRKEVVNNYLENIELFTLFTGFSEGDICWFKAEPIEWRVLDVNRKKGVLLVAEKILSGGPFSAQDSDGGNKWETSDIREFLNGEFYNMAFFNETKLPLVQDTENYYMSYPSRARRNLPSTKDTVRLLGYEEAKNSKYFADDLDRISTPTAYASACGAMKITEELIRFAIESTDGEYDNVGEISDYEAFFGSGIYWTNTSDDGDENAYVVYEYGNLLSYYYFTADRGMRPVIRLPYGAV